MLPCSSALFRSRDPNNHMTMTLSQQQLLDPGLFLLTLDQALGLEPGKMSGKGPRVGCSAQSGRQQPRSMIGGESDLVHVLCWQRSVGMEFA